MRLTLFLLALKKILTELEALQLERPVVDTSETLNESDSLESESPTDVQTKGPEPILPSPEDIATGATPPPLEIARNGGEPSVPEVEAMQQVEEATGTEPSEPLGTDIDADESSSPDAQMPQQIKEKVAVPHPLRERPLESMLPKRVQEPERKPAPGPMALRLPITQDAVSVLSVVDSNLEFKIAVPSLPPSARATQRKAQVAAQLGTTALKRRGKGVFGQLAQTLGFAAGGRRGKVYYQQKGEAVQNAFQDQLAKVERDYNEGYGLNLLDWDMDRLSEEEIAILLLNLMVSEVIAWRKEIGRATPETERLVQVLDEVDTRLRRTLKQTRGVSTPSPTLFPDLLAESKRDLEKIQNECDAYLQRFSGKLIEQEKAHAEKIEVLIFKKFLIEFIRDFLFAEVVESTQGNALPERLNWFLDLVDSEVIPIEVGETKVSPKHHKVKGARSCEFETGTIVEVVKAGLQSKDQKRVNQMAIVIEAE